MFFYQETVMSYPMILRTIKIRDVIKNKIAKKIQSKKVEFKLKSRVIQELS